MIKVKQIKNLLHLRDSDYIKVDGVFKPIKHVSYTGGIADLELQDGKFILTDNDIGKYEFGEMSDFSDEIRTEISYSCKHCNNPNFVFDTIDGAKIHTDNCLFNEKRKSCVMCKHLKVIEQAPYPRNEKQYISLETYHAFGAFRQPYCMLKDIDISEDELWDSHEDCFEVSYESAVVERSEEYEKWVELSTADDVEEFYEDK